MNLRSLIIYPREELARKCGISKQRLTQILSTMDFKEHEHYEDIGKVRIYYEKAVKDIKARQEKNKRYSSVK